MIYLGTIVGLLLIALGAFKESSLVCEMFDLGRFSGNRVSCDSGIWSTPDFLIVAGTATILCSLLLVWLKKQMLRILWLIGFLLILASYLSEGFKTCGDILCLAIPLIGIAFYVIGLVLWTLLILGINLLLKHLRSRKIKPSAK